MTERPIDQLTNQPVNQSSKDSRFMNKHFIAIAGNIGVGKSSLVGLLADRYGRRIPLMIDLVFFSVIEVLTGLAPNFTTFLVLRALFGIGMGGECGVGASLAMEKAPTRLRGMLSGFLQ